MNNLQSQLEDEQNQVYTLSRKIKELQVSLYAFFSFNTHINLFFLSKLIRFKLKLRNLKTHF